MPRNLNHKYFIDRADAAQQLCNSIPLDSFEEKNLIVIALSTGGVFLADIIAQKLKCDMDILLSESIYAPSNPELSIAKITETRDILMHIELIDSFGIEEEYVYKEAQRVYEERIVSHLYKYRKGENLQSINGRVVILVDECVETGFTMAAAIKSMVGLDVNNVYVATPILDESSYESLIQMSDGIFCAYRIRDYISIECYYENLETLELSAIERILTKYEQQDSRDKCK